MQTVALALLAWFVLSLLAGASLGGLLALSRRERELHRQAELVPCQPGPRSADAGRRTRAL